jgi:hypothetical protein
LDKKNKKKFQLPINAAVGTVKIRPFGTNLAQYLWSLRAVKLDISWRCRWDEGKRE